MKIDKLRVPEGSKVDLKDYPTDYSGDYKDKKQAVADLEKNIERLAELQDILYAQNVHSLLIIFQAMDAAGKDGAIKHVMSGLNPQGCHVVSFKAPSAATIAHDYLWRCQKNLPERGRIAPAKSLSSASVPCSAGKAIRLPLATGDLHGYRGPAISSAHWNASACWPLPIQKRLAIFRRARSCLD